MINEFLQYLQYEKNYSSHTVLSYHTDLIQFCEFLSTDTDKFNPTLVEPEQIQQWVLALMTSELSARTLSRKISTLRSFWRFLLIRSYATKNPTIKIILPKTNKPLPLFFKQREMETVLSENFLPDNFIALRNHLIIETFYLTGIRLSELIGIKDTDVDLAECNLRVTGKRNKERIIPFSNDFSKKIEQYIRFRNEKLEAITPHLFVRENGKKLYPYMVYNLIHNTMSQISSLSKKSPHILRHTFATGMLNEGADINAVKELLGHSSLSATQIYTHTSFDELYNIYKHTHPRVK